MGLGKTVQSIALAPVPPPAACDLTVSGSLVSGSLAAGGDLTFAVTGASLLLIPATAGSDGAVAMVVLVATFIYGVIGFWLFIEMAFLRGTRGENRFGPDPLEGRP